MCVRSHKNVCGINVCVSGWKGRGRDVEEKSATVDHHIIKKKSDSANSVSVRIQITNKCRTLLNRPLAIIAGPTRYFQNLWRLPVYLAINPHHVTNRFVTGNDLLSQGYMKWSWPLLDRQELNWPTHPSQLSPPHSIAPVSPDKKPWSSDHSTHSKSCVSVPSLIHYFSLNGNEVNSTPEVWSGRKLVLLFPIKKIFMHI